MALRLIAPSVGNHRSNMAICCFLAYLCLGLSLLIVDARASAGAYEKKSLDAIVERMGNVLPTGALRWSVSIAELNLGGGWMWRWSLQHSIEIDTFGKSVTVWRWIGSRTYLLTTGGTWQWHEPAGNVIAFRIGGDGHFHANTKPKWRLEANADGLCRLTSEDGRTYLYKDGNILEAWLHEKLCARFVATNGFINSIVVESSPKETADAYCVLKDGLIIGITVKGRKHVFNWDEAGKLRTWFLDGELQYMFTYSERTITKIESQKLSPILPKWTKASVLTATDSAFFSPYWLLEDGKYNYNYRYSDGSLVIETKEKGSDSVVKTIYKPTYKTITQTKDGH